MIARRMAWGAVLAAVAACGPKPISPGVADLERFVSEREDAALAEASAPGEFAAGRRYLALAREAMDARRTDQAERYAALGAIHIKIALAAAEQARAEERRAAAESKRKDLEREQERLASAVAAGETALERARIREHLVRVVDETRRRAAAEEELRIAGRKDSDRKAIGDARACVGLEMLERVRVWRDALAVAARAGNPWAAHAGEVVGGAIALAETRLGEGDLAEVQRQAEIAGVAARGVWADGASSDAAELTALGFQVVAEEMGPAVRIEREDQARKLGEMLAKRPDLGAVVLAAAYTHERRAEADKESKRRAEEIASELAAAGVEPARVLARGVGPATPIAALGQGRIRVAVLLVPLAEAK